MRLSCWYGICHLMGSIDRIVSIISTNSFRCHRIIFPIRWFSTTIYLYLPITADRSIFNVHDINIWYPILYSLHICDIINIPRIKIPPTLHTHVFNVVVKDNSSDESVVYYRRTFVISLTEMLYCQVEVLLHSEHSSVVYKNNYSSNGDGKMILNIDQAINLLNT